MNNLKYNVKKLGIVVQEFVVSEGGTKIVEKVYNCPDNVLQDKNVRAKALCVKRQTPILLTVLKSTKAMKAIDSSKISLSVCS